ncbi:MAG TPA: hypothetical protein VMV92_07530 [Streptosporangiaceae bacterium]|nr:hypothetical protein [Streptosporangiaceae bacterium]
MTEDGEWDLEFYQDESGREPCREWIEGLSREKRLAVETVLEHVLAMRGLSVVETEFGKALGQGLYELRLRWSAEEVANKVGVVLAQPVTETESILLRVFFCTSGSKIIMLLSGYDKARDPNDRRQAREIAAARKLLTAHREAERRARARRPRPTGRR